MQVTETRSPSIFNYQAGTKVRARSGSVESSTVHAAPDAVAEPMTQHPRQSNSSLDKKMADLGRIQNAFIAALRSGRDLERHFEPIL